MITIRHQFLGIVACALVMIPAYIGLWLVDIGGLVGMMNDDSYPMSIFMLPLIAAILSGVAFWLAVFPFAHFARWISNRLRMTILCGGLIAVCCSALLGALFGAISGGLYAALIYACFLGTAAFVFWVTTAKRKNVEQGAAPNP